MKQNDKEVVELEAGEGDIIIADREPYVIDDDAIIEGIKIMRDTGTQSSVINGTGKKVTILEYIKGQVLSKTLVRIEDAK